MGPDGMPNKRFCCSAHIANFGSVEALQLGTRTNDCRLFAMLGQI